MSNVIANAVKHTKSGGILVEWGEAVDQDIEDALEAKADSIRVRIAMCVIPFLSTLVDAVLTVNRFFSSSLSTLSLLPSSFPPLLPVPPFPILPRALFAVIQPCRPISTIVSFSTDTGIGMSEEKLEKLFREFEQVSTISGVSEDASVSAEQAVGLGLAVVARVTRNMGGQLSVESKEGEGTKVRFTPFSLPSTPIVKERRLSQRWSTNGLRDIAVMFSH